MSITFLPDYLYNANRTISNPPMKKITLLFLLAILAIPFLSAQDTLTTEQPSEVPKKIYITKRIIGEAPTIDGRIEDAAWQTVAWGGSFSQMEPNDGAPPLQLPNLKFYTTTNLFMLAIECTMMHQTK